MLKITVFIASIISVCTLNTVYAQPFYKWVDEHGTTHYTETPPQAKKGIQSKGIVKTYGNTVNTNNIEAIPLKQIAPEQPTSQSNQQQSSKITVPAPTNPPHLIGNTEEQIANY